MYETIINILEKNGPSSIKEICDEINQSRSEKRVNPSNIKLSLSRKKDLFSIENDLVMLQPDKEFVTLSVDIGVFPDLRYHVNIHFQRGVFHVFEWREPQHSSNNKAQVKVIGSVEEFKKTLYRLKIWNWDETKNVPQLDHYNGTILRFKLMTKGASYENIGYDPLTNDWKAFRRALEQLTGISL